MTTYHNIYRTSEPIEERFRQRLPVALHTTVVYIISNGKQQDRLAYKKPCIMTRAPSVSFLFGGTNLSNFSGTVVASDTIVRACLAHVVSRTAFVTPFRVEVSLRLVSRDIATASCTVGSDAAIVTESGRVSARRQVSDAPHRTRLANSRGSSRLRHDA